MPTRVVNVKDVAADKFIAAYAAHLKKSGKVAVPAWVDIVKTSVGKELSPLDNDWFYVRIAALARTLYMRPGSGIGALRRRYGAAKNNGLCPSHKALSSGAVVRKAIHQLEALGIVEKTATGAGRKITSKGQRELDRIAGQVAAAAL